MFKISVLNHPDMGVICTHEIFWIVNGSLVASQVMRDQYQIELIIF